MNWSFLALQRERKALRIALGAAATTQAPSLCATAAGWHRMGSDFGKPDHRKWKKVTLPKTNITPKNGGFQ